MELKVFGAFASGLGPNSFEPCFGRAEILAIFGRHFGRNDDLINSF